MPLIYFAVIDLCFILDVDVLLICALITAVYRTLTFIEKPLNQRETRQLVSRPGFISWLACSKLLLAVPCTTQLKNFKSSCVNNYQLRPCRPGFSLKPESVNKSKDVYNYLKSEELRNTRIILWHDLINNTITQVTTINRNV